MDSPEALGADINAQSAQYPVVMFDAVESLSIHNGVVRLLLSRLTAEGASTPALELMTPCTVVAQIISALQAVKT